MAPFLEYNGIKRLNPLLPFGVRKADMMAQQIVDIAKIPTIEPVLQSLKQLYIFRRSEKVSEFLDTHPLLVPLLVEAYSRIGDYFGPQPQVILEVVTDPEAMDDRQLVAFIRTDLHPAEALARLDRLDKDWWFEASHRSLGKLCLHLEYQ